MNWLRDLRLKAGKTLKEVGDGAGVSECYVSQIETGARKPSVEVAKRLAAVLGVSWTRFFEEG